MTQKNRDILCYLVVLICLGHMPASHANEKVWILFKNKNPVSGSKAVSASELGLSQRCLERRSRVRSYRELIDDQDYPVSSSHLSSLESLGIQIQVESRWLNGVSAVLSSEQKEMVRSLRFVREIRPVAFAIRDYPLTESTACSAVPADPTIHVHDYGISLRQNDQIHVPAVHDLGITGKDVFIGMLDTGFNFRDRPVFEHLNVVAEYDFIWDDDTTANSEDEPTRQDDHGTETLSVIAGYHSGNLIGPAFDAQFALAKTEWLATETRIEEDFWVAGLEWLEAQGVEIVSSSVAYNKFDDGFSYSYKDLDGASCVTTIAAEIAFDKGMLVVNSAGNERNNAWHYIMSPADGEHVLAAGAVDLTGDVTYFSSVGPTSDGRIKPDVMAMGMGVVAANPNRESSSEYFYLSGTSFSCPLIAGLCALVLDAHPELTPGEILEAVRMTADRSFFPDTLYGRGIANAYEAVFYHGMIFRQFKWMYDTRTDAFILQVSIHSKQGVNPNSVICQYRDSKWSPFETVQMELSQDSTRFSADLAGTINPDSLRFYIQAEDGNGVQSRGPWDAPLRVYTLSDTAENEFPVPVDQPDSIVLYPAYPNPFNQTVHLEFDLQTRAEVLLKIFNIHGQVVRTLISRQFDSGTKRATWDGRDERGAILASGVYFARLSILNQTHVIKISLIR